MWLFCLVRARTHTHTHARAHVRTRARTHAHLHTAHPQPIQHAGGIGSSGLHRDPKKKKVAAKRRWGKLRAAVAAGSPNNKSNKNNK